MRAKLFRPHQHVLNSISFIISVLLLSLFIPRHDAKHDTKLYKACNNTITYACDEHIREGIGFPFWGHRIRPRDCGLQGYELMCEESGLVVDIGRNNRYHVVEIYPSEEVLSLNHTYNPLDHICEPSPSSIPDTILNKSLFIYTSETVDLHLFYNCKDEMKYYPNLSNFTCGNEDENLVYYFWEDLIPPALEPRSCYRTILPVNKTVLEEFMSNQIQLEPQELFRRSFEVYYSPSQKACEEYCSNVRGLCWNNTYPDSKDACLFPGFELSCEESGLAVEIGSSIKYHVVGINSSTNVIQLNWIDNPLDFICKSSSNSIPLTVLNQNLYEYGHNTGVLHLLYHCGDDIQKPTPVDYNFTCQNEEKDLVYFFWQNSLPPAKIYESSCSHTTLPVNTTLLEEFLGNPQQLQLQELFRFEVYYYIPNEQACADCMSDGGLCWSRTYSYSSDPCLYPRSGVA